MNNSFGVSYRSCVGLMIINDKKTIFTAQRLDFVSAAWQMPQGGINAVSKGWFSYDLPLDLVPKLWNGAYKGQKQKWFLMKFSGNENQINLKTEIPEFSCWRWSTKQQLIDSIVPFKRDLYRSVVKEFQTFLNIN